MNAVNKIVMKALVAMVWCGMAVGCVADGIKNRSAESQEKIPQYQFYADSRLSAVPGEDRSLCKDFLQILNTVPYEKLYQDIFLDVLKGKENFDTAGFEYLENGEEKYGEMVFKRFELSEKPSRVEKRIKGHRKYKEEVGGFDYYLTHDDVFLNGKQFPILFYVNKNLLPLDKRKGFDYVVMEEDMSGPNLKSYDHGKLILEPSYAGQIFRHKGKIYVLDSAYQPHLIITPIRGSVSGCEYEPTY